MRYRVAHLGALGQGIVSACTTSLSYKFDGGAEGGTLPDAAPIEGGPPLDGAPAGCAATAQFCDDFEGATKWGTLDWNILDRMDGPRNGNAFAANKMPRGLGHGLELLGKAGPGGFAFPARPLERRGANKQLSIRFSIAFLDAKDGTILELGPQDKPETVRLSVRGPRLYYNNQDTGADLPITGDSPVDLTVVLSEDLGTSKIAVSNGYNANLPPSFPTDFVEVRFAVTPQPDAAALAGSMKVVVDDILIE